jgi:hypothetical protein
MFVVLKQKIDETETETPSIAYSLPKNNSNNFSWGVKFSNRPTPTTRQRRRNTAAQSIRNMRIHVATKSSWKRR